MLLKCVHISDHTSRQLSLKKAWVCSKNSIQQANKLLYFKSQRPIHLPCRNSHDWNALLIDSDYFSGIDVFNLQTWSEHSRLTLKMSPWKELTELGIPSNLPKPLFSTVVLKAVPKLHWFENTYYKTEIAGKWERLQYSYKARQIKGNTILWHCFIFLLISEKTLSFVDNNFWSIGSGCFKTNDWIFYKPQEDCQWNLCLTPTKTVSFKTELCL